jgi:hypothetical protein
MLPEESRSDSFGAGRNRENARLSLREEAQNDRDNPRFSPLPLSFGSAAICKIAALF